MRYEKIDDKARVWTVTRGPDGRLQAELDEHILATLDPLALAIAVGRPVQIQP